MDFIDFLHFLCTCVWACALCVCMSVCIHGWVGVHACVLSSFVNPAVCPCFLPTVRQYADICLFSTAQYKCPVAQVEAEWVPFHLPLSLLSFLIPLFSL